jgi:hypothetical protein
MVNQLCFVWVCRNNEMGALLDKPKTDKFNEQGEWNKLRYGLASMQGWRIEMEVRTLTIIIYHSITINNNNNKGCTLRRDGTPG